MANLCDTTYVISMDSEEKVARELNEILENLSKEYPYNIPVYAFLEALGYDEDGSYRGSVYYFSYDEKDKELTIDVESAWCKIPEIETAIYQKYGDELSIIWATEEFGCGIFETNDTCGIRFSTNYYYFSSEDGGEYLDGEQELIEYVNEYFESDVCDCEESAFAYVEEHNGEEFGYPTLYKREIL